MSLKHVILVVLKKGSASGYDINQTFEGPLGIFWSTSHQRVYRALATLTKDDWVSFEHQPQAGKPDKKIYSIRPIGDAELTKWLDESQQSSPVNESLLVKFFAGELCPTPALLKQIEQLSQENRIKLEYYRTEADKITAGIDHASIEVRRGYLTLRRGILMEEARLEWCLEAIAMLKQDLGQ